jgi:hypothetical protein
MSRLGFEKIIFRLNILITGVVFFLLAPTVRVYRSWFPDKEASLWIIPLAVIFVSLALWTLVRLGIPYFIRQGWMEELRQESRPPEPWPQRFMRIGPSVALTAFHLLLLVLFSAALIRFLEHEPFKKLLTNLP